MNLYKLGGGDGHTPVLVGDFYAEFEAASKRDDVAALRKLALAAAPQSLRRTDTPDGGEISTIFLTVVAGRPESPMCFETGIIKPNGKVNDIFRHATWAEAMAFHDALVADFKTTMAKARSDRDDEFEGLMALVRELVADRKTK